MSSYHRLDYETPLNTWARTDDRTDLSSRLAASYRLSPEGGAINKYDSLYERSTGQRTSLAVHNQSEAPSSAASDITPALTRGYSNASSTDSAKTAFASGLDGYPLLESVDGALEVPVIQHPHADLICLFQILDCEERFSDFVQWKTHVLSHFRGRGYPNTARCFLCDQVFCQSRNDQPERAWSEMLLHMATAHFRGMGQSLATVRTDFDLMRWMFNQRIITSAQFKRTQMMPVPAVLPESRGQVVNIPEAPMPPPPIPSTSTMAGQGGAFTVQASQRRERRSRSNRM